MDLQQVLMEDTEFTHVPYNIFPKVLIDHYRDPIIGLNLKGGLEVARRRVRITENVIAACNSLEISLNGIGDANGFLGRLTWQESKKLVETGLNGRIFTSALYFPVLRWARMHDIDLAQDLLSYGEFFDNITRYGRHNAEANYIAHPNSDYDDGYDYGKVIKPYDKHFNLRDINKLTGLPRQFRDNDDYKQYYPERSLTVVVRYKNYFMLSIPVPYYGEKLKNRRDNDFGVRVIRTPRA